MFDLNLKSVVHMDGETLKTLSFCSLFVFLFGALGFVVGIILNALTFYIETSSNQMYTFLVESKIFAITSIPYYLLAAVLFAGLGVFIVYMWNRTASA
jgi:hypothetical protein